MESALLAVEDAEVIAERKLISKETFRVIEAVLLALLSAACNPRKISVAGEDVEDKEVSAEVKLCVVAPLCVSCTQPNGVTRDKLPVSCNQPEGVTRDKAIISFYP